MSPEAENIIKKLKAKKKLSLAEERIYLTKLFGFTLQQAKVIIAIASNKNKYLLID
jgi:hypothetical protein